MTDPYKGDSVLCDVGTTAEETADGLK